MANLGFLNLVGICLLILFQPKTCLSSIQKFGKLNPGFEGDQMHWIDNNGLFLLSNNSNFALGFTTTAKDVTLFVLAIVHVSSQTTVWSANRATPIRNSDTFKFDEGGNVYLERGGSQIWSTDTANKGVVAMELWESGNLVLLEKDGNVVWQSFSHPVDSLLSN